MGGGAGRGKHQKGPTGRRTFSTQEEMESGESSLPAWRTRRMEKEQDADEGDQPMVEGEEEEGEEAQGPGAGQGAGNTSAQGSSKSPAVHNPNLPGQGGSMFPGEAASSSSQLSRREREELAKQQAKERYMKLQEEGKTEQSKKDLERLAMIRRQREEAAKKREEERLAKEAKKKDARA